MAKASNKKTENLICNSTDSINTSGSTVPVSDETESGGQNSSVLSVKASDKNTDAATDGEVKQSDEGTAGGTVKQSANGTIGGTDKQSANGTTGGTDRQSASEADNQSVGEAAAEPDKKNIPAATNAYPGEKLVRIRIPHAEDDGDVFVSVNDRNWYIKRGSEVEIPECAAEVLIRREERIADAINYENKLAANRRH
nr:MAG TPA: hypothetical protein [Caudoviricetes sp.]